MNTVMQGPIPLSVTRCNSPLKRGVRAALNPDWRKFWNNISEEGIGRSRGNFQTGSEEQETSKEALQSTNEELMTVNTELQKKVEELSEGRWDLPELRRLLKEILPEKNSFENCQMEHEIPGMGRQKLTLNARRIQKTSGKKESFLLAIETA